MSFILLCTPSLYGQQGSGLSILDQIADQQANETFILVAIITISILTFGVSVIKLITNTVFWIEYDLLQIHLPKMIQYYVRKRTQISKELSSWGPGWARIKPIHRIGFETRNTPRISNAV